MAHLECIHLLVTSTLEVDRDQTVSASWWKGQLLLDYNPGMRVKNDCDPQSTDVDLADVQLRLCSNTGLLKPTETLYQVSKLYWSVNGSHSKMPGTAICTISEWHQKSPPHIVAKRVGAWIPLVVIIRLAPAGIGAKHIGVFIRRNLWRMAPAGVIVQTQGSFDGEGLQAYGDHKESSAGMKAILALLLHPKMSCHSPDNMSI